MADHEHDDGDEDQQLKKKKDRPVRKVTVKDTDMGPELMAEVVEFINQGLDDYKLAKDIARHVKTQLDTKGGVWHVIVGSHFACNTTHDAGTLLNITLDTTTILVFRNGPPMKSTE